MLVSNYGKIIAGGDDASVEDDEIIFARGKNNSLLGSATEGDASEENGWSDKLF